MIGSDGGCKEYAVAGVLASMHAYFQDYHIQCGWSFSNSSMISVNARAMHLLTLLLLL